jgi:DNA-binding NarL/FixJ family response regulator
LANADRGPQAHDRFMSSRVQGPSELLTARELQIAVLKAQGFANKAIARRLGISRSTVTAHLARTYSKLGVSRRSTLAARIAGTVALHRRSADPAREADRALPPT